MNRLKLITLILLTFTLNVCAQNYIIRQDSLRASEYRLKNAIKDSLNANTRGWQTEAQVRQIAGDSSQVAETRAKNYTDAQFNNNPKGWQTASQVRSIVGDSSNVLRGLINSGAGLDTNAVRNIAKQSALDTLKIVSIYSQEPSGSNAYAIVNIGGELRRLMLQNLPTQLQVQTQIQALWDSLGRVAAGLGGVTPTYPNPVTNLTATADNQKVTLNWTNPSQRDSIRIERASSLTGGTVFTQLAYVGANTTTYVDTPVVNNVTYTYRLRVYYQGFASSSVTVDAVPTAPPVYLTIQPTSVDYDTISAYTIPSDSVAMTAEQANMEDSFSATNLNITRVDSAKYAGSLGYHFKVTSAGGTGYLVKNVTSQSSGDTVDVYAYFKIPYNYIGIGSTSNQFVPLKLSNDNTDNTTNETIGFFVIRASTTNPTFYRYVYRSGGSGSSLTTVTPTSITLTRGQTYKFTIRYMRNSDNTNCRIVFYINADSVGGANNINIGNSYGTPNRVMVGIREMYGGTNSANQLWFADDIVIKGKQGSGTVTDYKYADVLVKNDSSTTIRIREIVTPKYPFQIVSGDTTITRLEASQSVTYTIRFNRMAYLGNYWDTLKVRVEQDDNSVTDQLVTIHGNSEGVPPPGGGGIITADYYFDAILGDDANSGTSPTQAWKTVSKFNATNFPAGSVIAFRDSMTYEGSWQLTESGNSSQRITVTNWYGSSSQKYPEFILEPKRVGWSQTAGYTNVWEASAPNNFAVWFLFADSSRWGVRESGLATLDREFETYYASGKLYVYSPENPTNRYVAVRSSSGTDEFPPTATVWNIAGSYITLQYLSVGYSRGKGISVNIGADYAEIFDCNAYYCGKSILLSAVDDGGDGIYIQNSNAVVKRCTTYENAGHGYYVWGGGGTAGQYLQNVLIDSCVAWNNHHTAGIDINSDRRYIRNVTVRNSLVYTTIGTWFWRYHWVGFNSTDGAGLGTGNTVGRAMGNFVKGESLGLVKQIYFYNNIVMNTGGASIQTEGNCDSVYIYNNTLIQNKNFGEGTSSEGTFKAWNWALYTNTSDGHLWIRNNAVYALISRSTNYIVKPMTNGANNFVVSNNVVYRADGSSYLVEGYTLSSSFNQNPNFTSFSGYHPPAWNLLQQATSPLNDNGFTLGSPYNLDRRGISRPQGSAYDVGAYER